MDPGSTADAPAVETSASSTTTATTQPHQHAASTAVAVPASSGSTSDEAWRQRIAGLQHEFNAQRARMKDMFLQKEADCKQLQVQLDESRSQLAVLKLRNEDGERHAQDEIVSLQQVVYATIEESSHFKVEIDRLLGDVERLRLENGRLNEELSQQVNTIRIFAHTQAQYLHFTI